MSSSVDSQQASSADAVVAQHLLKSFPESYRFSFWLKHRGKVPRRSALRDVSISVRKGELFGLLGPNGAGKTTLLKTLATLTIPDKGVIKIAGIDALEEPEKARGRIGLCTSEDRSFYFRLTARQNLEFFGTLAGLRGAQLRRRIQEVILQVDLDADLDRRFSTYSSGMRQRLSIARALLADPEIIFLDEPTRAVDPTHAESIRRFVRDQLVSQRGKTVILATNLLEEAWALCDRIAILNRGVVVALGSPESLSADAMNEQRVYSIMIDRVTEDLLSRTRSLPGVTSVKVQPQMKAVRLEVQIALSAPSLNELLRTVSSNGASVLSFETERAKPAEVFAGLVKVDDDEME